MSHFILNSQQESILGEQGNLFITACPGSGKTRLLIHKIIQEVTKLKSSKHRIIALTYTNRAADEIKSRFDEYNMSFSPVWAGTIHSFALEWILRPYSCYSDRLKYGFHVADEPYTRNLLKNLKSKHNIKPDQTINTRIDRMGKFLTPFCQEQKLLTEYHQQLYSNGLIDYDLILYFAYKVLVINSEIAKTLGSFIKLICVDEYQDTQDLQYGILSKISTASNGFTKVFIVGDPDQAIYSTLGGVVKTANTIRTEFGLNDLKVCQLTGNYRSTQRIIDFYRQLLPNCMPIQSLANHATEAGSITFSNLQHRVDEVPAVISHLVKQSLDKGVKESNICVLAPKWQILTDMSRHLVQSLPSVHFDAPGLSPFNNLWENIWFRIARLYLGGPEPNMYTTRLRWATEVIFDIEQQTGQGILDTFSSPRNLLRLINSKNSHENAGLPHLEEIFVQLLRSLEVDLSVHAVLNESWHNFLKVRLIVLKIFKFLLTYIALDVYSHNQKVLS